mgnify:CR=1 FL=1
MAPQLSPFTRTFAVPNPRQLAPTMGLAHGDDEFLEGSFPTDQEVHDFPDEESQFQKDIRCQPAVGIEHTKLRFGRF